jgi:hypothetical protein|tara:strand:- start:28131 stop:29987 length:1857 start_codon:yes stop_codon:yes gene_type:complete
MSAPDEPVEELICQKASPLSIASLIGSVTVFKVPPFQRDYAWDTEAVSLFINDIKRCHKSRIDGTHTPHFFGAIVTYPELEAGTPRPHSMLVDGQQRIATVFLYLMRLRDQFSAAEAAADSQELTDVFSTRASEITSTFDLISDLEFNAPIQRRKLSLNRADNPYFNSLLDGQDVPATRASHERLKCAANLIDTFFAELLDRCQGSAEVERVLNSLYSSFLRDLEIVHIAARTRQQAHTVYRVLNSRGVPVCDAELLRASTLERLDRRISPEDFSTASGTWDSILGLDGAEPDEFLDIAYQSKQGNRRPKDRTATTFEESFFPALASEARLNRAEADGIVAQITTLETDCKTISRMLKGDPCRPAGLELSAVAKERFKSLTNGLRQTYCIPLILAAQGLRTPAFSELIECLDRFAFRYSVIAEAPIGEYDRLVAPYIERLRRNPADLDIRALRAGLSELCEEFAGADTFRRMLSALRYGSGDNAKIRYMLAMIEWTNTWYVTNNAQGQARITDDIRGIDLSKATLEHILARRANGVTADMVPMLNSIGNLTLLSETDNNDLGNADFELKAPTFSRSSFAINRALTTNGKITWTAADITQRETDFIDRCVRIFTLVPVS